MHSSRVTSLFEAADGTLWIGDESGQVTRYQDGRFQAVPFHAAWSGGKIYDIAADESGDIWLLNESGQLARVRDGLVLTPEAGTASKLVNMTRSANGTIWVARDGRVSVLEHGQLRPLELNGAATNNTYVMGIGASHDGGLWVAGDGRIRKWKDGKWAEDLGLTPWDTWSRRSRVGSKPKKAFWLREQRPTVFIWLFQIEMKSRCISITPAVFRPIG